MRILLIALILFIGVSESRAQQQFTYCVDSTRIEDKFWPCGTSYEPVCVVIMLHTRMNVQLTIGEDYWMEVGQPAPFAAILTSTSTLLQSQISPERLAFF